MYVIIIIAVISDSSIILYVLAKGQDDGRFLEEGDI